MKRIAIGVGENENIIQALIKSVFRRDVDAVIRGSLSASNIIAKLKERYPHLSRASYINNGEQEFLLTPVGIDEGNTVEDKFRIAMNCIDFLKQVEKTPKIAILAEGREDDFGRDSAVSNSIKDSRKLTKLLSENTDEDVKNYHILIEKAIQDKCNVIIAPNGRVGNIIFRTMVLLNSWPSYGAVTFGMDRIYIDTSRDQSIEGYLRSLVLAEELIED